MRSLLVTIFLMLCVAAAGCGRPDAANIALRRENQQLHAELEQLRRQHAGDVAQMKAMQPGGTAPSVQLPVEQLENLFTVADLKIGRLTGPADLDMRSPGVEGIKVYTSPVDEAGDVVKMAGAFLVEVTDPARSPEPLLGRWTFPVEDAQKNWHGMSLLQTYVLACPWENRPEAKEARVKVTFTDALTGRVIGPVEKKVKLESPEQQTTDSR